MLEAPNSPHVMMTPKGGAQIVATDGQNVTLHAGFVSPPGSPLSGVLNGTEHQLQVKVHGCRRITSNASDAATDATSPTAMQVPPNVPRSSTEGIKFEITGRWVSLSREARGVLLGQTP